MSTMTEAEQIESLQRQITDLVGALQRSQTQTEHALANTDKAIAAAKEAIQMYVDLKRATDGGSKEESSG